MTATLQQQLKIWCILHGMDTPSSETSDKYKGLKECFKNVIRTNNSRKLQYCLSPSR